MVFCLSYTHGCTVSLDKYRVVLYPYACARLAHYQTFTPINNHIWSQIIPFNAMGNVIEYDKMEIADINVEWIGRVKGQ